MAEKRKKQLQVANDFKKFVRCWLIQNDMSALQLAEKCNVTISVLQALLDLRVINKGLVNQLFDYMGITEEEEERLSEIVDKATVRIYSIQLSGFPDEIIDLFLNIKNNYRSFTGQKIKKLLSMTGD